MPEDPADLSQPEDLPKKQPTQISLSQEMRRHQQKLEEIRKKLNPGKLNKVLNTDVQTYKNDISSIFDYLEEIEGTGEVFNYITSAELLNLKLRDIMIEFQSALDSWNTSNEVGWTVPQISEWRTDYLRRLGNCYGLLKDALKFFL